MLSKIKEVVKKPLSKVVGMFAALTVMVVGNSAHAQAVTVPDTAPTMDFNVLAASLAGLGNKAFNLLQGTLMPYVYVAFYIALSIVALGVLWILVVKGFTAIRGKFGKSKKK